MQKLKISSGKLLSISSGITVDVSENAHKYLNKKLDINGVFLIDVLTLLKKDSILKEIFIPENAAPKADFLDIASINNLKSNAFLGFEYFKNLSPDEIHVDINRYKVNNSVYSELAYIELSQYFDSGNLQGKRLPELDFWKSTVGILFTKDEEGKDIAKDISLDLCRLSILCFLPIKYEPDILDIKTKQYLYTVPDITLSDLLLFLVSGIEF